ncbi:HET-domain-containing protein [Apiospora marii]|uniref:HET-domain-containing protein n=1 Tax=Apiospora marii TaxID=335849 RepID=A0ABR1R0G7_9PEZI
MAATTTSDRTQAQSPSHGEQSPTRHPSEDQGLCDRCQEWDLTELHTRLTARIDGLKTVCKLGILHENCRLCRVFADSFRYKFSEVKSALRDLRLTVFHYHNAPMVTSYDHFRQVTRSSRNVLCVRDSSAIHDDAAYISMSLEEPGEASDPQADNWGRQPCNVSWLTRCMRQCAEKHQSCRAELAHQFDAPVYFIDCDTRKLCKSSQDMPYTALSYVWGKEHTNDEALGLDYFTALPALLPRTIENAIALTRQLGMRYLWVDRYCITNSEKDSAIRHDQLKTMDQIYGQAEVTIVSLGDGPHTGLPGVDGTPRWIRRWEVIKGYTFRTTFRNPRHVILRSKWNERGWTYQEACLSRRMIYFTPEEALFECSLILRSEVENCLSPSPRETSPMFDLEPLFTTTGFGLHLPALMHCINTYLGRKLTYQSDVLNAFRGIIGKFERGPYAVQHYWGLPIYEHSVKEEQEKTPLVPPKLAVRQQHGSEETILGRSMSSMFAASMTWGLFVRSDCRRRRSGFPSWSWTGWELARCYQLYKSSDIGDVHIWIELSNREILHIDNFSSAGAFDLPPSQMSPYIYIECLTAPVRIVKRMVYKMALDSVRIGPEGKILTCVEFQRTDGLEFVCIPEIPEEKQFAEGTNCVVLVLGETAAEDKGLDFIMVVKEKAGFYERIGSLSGAHSNYGLRWAVRWANGKWVATNLSEIPKITLKKDKIRLG